MDIHVIELPKLPKELKEDSSDILLWAKFINAEKKEDFDMIAQKNSYIESAYQKLQNISQDKEKRLEYEAREKALRDHNQMILESETRGQTEMILLIQKLIQDKRFEDISRIEKDIPYRAELCKEYSIN